MEPLETSLNDGELRDHILEGLAAVEELERRFRQPLERFLLGKCKLEDGRSRAKAVDVASEILAECFTRKPSLLEKWQGPDNLEAFLHRAAENRLKTWWRSPDNKRIEVNSESLSLERATGPAAGGDSEETVMAERALRAGVEAAARDCPEGLVFLRLKGLHGVDQRAISRCWGHHEATTSRRISEAMEMIRLKARESAAAAGGELSMDDFQQAHQRDPLILLGCGEGAAPDHGDEALRLLAAGEAAGKKDEAVRQRAVKLMCGDARILSFFAQMLNRQDQREPLVVKDPALAGTAARLNECLRRSLAILQPAEAAGLVSTLMADSFADLLVHLGADGGTLWLLSPGAAALEAVFNPLEPEIAGMRQPLASGIVSLVLATGEPACVLSVADHRRHSPAIDLTLGKTTHSMVAVPFVLGGEVRGVVTAVRLVGENAFGERETAMLSRHAEILSGLLTQGLTAKILG